MVEVIDVRFKLRYRIWYWIRYHILRRGNWREVTRAKTETDPCVYDPVELDYSGQGKIDEDNRVRP